MPDIFFENVKTKKRYKVIKLDKAKGEITLQSQYGEFTEKYDKARFERLGYALVKEEAEAQAA